MNQEKQIFYTRQPDLFLGRWGAVEEVVGVGGNTLEMLGQNLHEFILLGQTLNNISLTRSFVEFWGKRRKQTSTNIYAKQHKEVQAFDPYGARTENLVSNH